MKIKKCTFGVFERYFSDVTNQSTLICFFISNKCMKFIYTEDNFRTPNYIVCISYFLKPSKQLFPSYLIIVLGNTIKLYFDIINLIIILS